MNKTRNDALPVGIDSDGNLSLQVSLPPELYDTKLPDPYAYYEWSLLNERVFYIDTEISVDTLTLQKAIISMNIEDAKNNIPVEKRKPIIVMLETPGGYLDDAMSLAETFVMSKTPIYTVNIGTAFSGGFILLIAGHKRFTFKYAKAMCHSGSGQISGTFEQTESQQRAYKKRIDEMKNFIVERTKIPASTVTKKWKTDWYLTSDEMIDYGVVDEVVDDFSQIFKDRI